jgi:hypothetical protein
MYTRFCGSAESFSRASRAASDGTAAEGTLTIGESVPWKVEMD